MFPRYPRHCSAFCIWALRVFFSSSSSTSSFFLFSTSSAAVERKKGSGGGKEQGESIGEAREARPLGRLWRISPRRRFNIYPYERRLRNLSSPLCSTCQSFPPVSRVVCALYLTLTRALYPRCSPSCSSPRILSAVSAGWRAEGRMATRLTSLSDECTFLRCILVKFGGGGCGICVLYVLWKKRERVK